LRKATAMLMQDEMRVEGEGDQGLRQKLLSGFRYIFVDEYQDINQDQYELLSALAGRTLLEREEEQLAIFAVGDDDQNIYGWNGASNAYIHQFEEEYQAKIMFMVENYRSCEAVVAAANSMIARHPKRMKEPYPIRSMGGEGQVLLYEGEPLALAQKSVTICQILIQQQDVLPQDIAILYRGHGDYSEVARLLRMADLPVRVIGQKRGLIWSRQRSAYAMLQCLDGNQAMSAQQIQQIWQTLDATMQCEEPFQQLWRELDAMAEGQESVMRSAAEWRMLLYDGMRDMSQQSGHGIHLGTMHSAKGLEFDSVILHVGRELNDKDEELRLRYVAMTRAKRNLCLMQRAGESFFEPLQLSAIPVARCTAVGGVEKDRLSCGMADVDMDYLGRLAHLRNTAELQVGDALQLQDQRYLMAKGEMIGALSQSFQMMLQARLKAGWRVDAVRIHAVVQRLKSDAMGVFQAQCRQEAWEVVLPEMDLSLG